MRYPSPALETRYSPTITPTQLMPTEIFSAEIRSGTPAGSTTFVKICSFVAPSVRIRSCFSSVAARKPFSTVTVVTTSETSTPITTIDAMPAPIHTMSTGPSAIFGSAFSTTRYGSSTRLSFGIHQRSTAMSAPRSVPRRKPSTVSKSVVPTCSHREPSA